jgi:hypothetical protein
VALTPAHALMAGMELLAKRSSTCASTPMGSGRRSPLWSAAPMAAAKMACASAMIVGQALAAKSNPWIVARTSAGAENLWAQAVCAVAAALAMAAGFLARVVHAARVALVVLPIWWHQITAFATAGAARATVISAIGVADTLGGYCARNV